MKYHMLLTRTTTETVEADVEASDEEEARYLGSLQGEKIPDRRWSLTEVCFEAEVYDGEESE